jgi:hypothetical protein
MNYTVYTQKWLDGPKEFDFNETYLGEFQTHTEAKQFMLKQVESDWMSAYWAMDELDQRYVLVGDELNMVNMRGRV